jgi:hypothetical protein
MKLASRPIPTALLLCAAASAWAQVDDLEVSLTPGAEEYCHVIQFPQVWVMPRSDEKTGQRLFFGSILGDLEFRVEGLQGSQFLVAGFTELLPPRHYTTNRFTVNLSDATSPIRDASREAWDAATVVPITRKSRFIPGNQPPEDKPLAFNGFQFAKSGEIWDQESAGPSRLSPDQAWLVLQSRARKKDQGPTRIYFDAFNVSTGKRIVTIEGTFSSDADEPPDDVLSKTGWLTERYFIVPLGKQLERCLVCEFGARRNAASKK